MSVNYIELADGSRAHLTVEDYDRVIEEFERAKALYGSSEEPLFHTYLAEAAKGTAVTVPCQSVHFQPLAKCTGTLWPEVQSQPSGQKYISSLTGQGYNHRPSGHGYNHSPSGKGLWIRHFKSWTQEGKFSK